MGNEIKSNTQQRRSWRKLPPWYNSPLGKLFETTESACLKEVMPTLFGYHLLVVGMSNEWTLFADSPILYQWQLETFQPATQTVDLLADPALLPLATECIDVVVLPHTLEFATSPHAILREVDRVLIPDGYVIILGFNPFSLWGIWRLLRARHSITPWDGRFLSVTRMRDWLALLGFETVAVRYHFYRPPMGRSAFSNKLLFLETFGAKWWAFAGGGYVLLAKKRVSTLTPIKPRWLTRPPPLSTGVVNGASRHSRSQEEELSDCD
jgi:SAM-dependent methyltransferase